MWTCCRSQFACSLLSVPVVGEVCRSPDVLIRSGWVHVAVSLTHCRWLYSLWCLLFLSLFSILSCYPPDIIFSPPVLHPSHLPFGHAVGGANPRGGHGPVSLQLFYDNWRNFTGSFWSHYYTNLIFVIIFTVLCRSFEPGNYVAKKIRNGCTENTWK